MDTEPLVRLEGSDGVLRIVLDRPPLNILSTAMLVRLSAVLRVAAEVGPRVVVLSGAGKAFSAGVDVADHTPARVHEMMGAFRDVLDLLLHLPMPVVAVAGGHALGGGFELTLAADVVLAREGATVGLPEVRLGAFPPFASALLPRLIGRQRALDLMLTGSTLSARRAHELGLVTHLFPADDFDAQVARYVSGLAQLSQPVLKLAKRALLQGLGMPLDLALRSAEELYLGELVALEDSREGIQAFLDKRQPAWSDA